MQNVIELNVNSKSMRFNLNYDVCKNPYCDCNYVNVRLANNDSRISFFLDLVKETYLKEDFSSEHIKIIKSFVEFVKSPKNLSLNIDFFKKFYEEVKNDAITRSDTLNSFELGSLMCYVEIFGKDSHMELKLGEKKYILFDSYCVTPDCECTNLALSFFEKLHTTGYRKPDFSFLYDYAKDSAQEEIGITKEQSNGMITSFSQKIKREFRKRHQELKEEVKEVISKKIEEVGFNKNSSKSRKLGRNEPCHCESGLKYKKCCMENDIEKFGKVLKVKY